MATVSPVSAIVALKTTPKEPLPFEFDLATAEEGEEGFSSLEDQEFHIL